MTGLAVFLMIWVTIIFMLPRIVGKWLAEVRCAYDHAIRALKDSGE